MYCKYCGSRIASDTTKCVSCGANIDLNDGGQSFFDDNELSAWQSDSISYNAQSNVPRTEMREPLPKKADFDEEYEKAFTKPQASVGTRGSYSRRRSKEKKNILDYLNISSSNKLIIFCIASALAIVLLVVAIIAVLNSGKDETTETTPTNYSTSVTDENTTNNTSLDNSSENDPVENSNGNTDDEAKENETKNNEKAEVKGIKILIDHREISHPVSAYIVNDKIYVSIDRVLKAEGYKAGVKTNYNENRIRYDHAKTSKAIEIEKGTNKIWIRENDENVTTQYLDGANFNEGSDTYVAAKSFLNKIGYSKVDYDKETMTLTVSK